jgi:hypothetical protein
VLDRDRVAEGAVLALTERSAAPRTGEQQRSVSSPIHRDHVQLRARVVLI